jgi:hypothetical protein
MRLTQSDTWSERSVRIKDDMQYRHISVHAQNCIATSPHRQIAQLVIDHSHHNHAIRKLTHVFHAPRPLCLSADALQRLSFSCKVDLAEQLANQRPGSKVRSRIHELCDWSANVACDSDPRSLPTFLDLTSYLGRDGLCQCICVTQDAVEVI